MRAESEQSTPQNTRFLPIRRIDSTGSTNRDLLEAAASGAPEGQVLLADHQRAGRGRQGRVWLDEPGSSLLASWLLRPSRDHLSVLPLLSGLAVAQTLSQSYGLDVGLKWPNDVLSVPDTVASTQPGNTVSQQITERKLAGILVEAVSTGSKVAVVVGLGLNLRFPAGIPAEIGEIATDLASLLGGGPPDAVTLLGEILESIEVYLLRLESDGRERILGEYRSACVTLGRRVRMDTPGGIVEGQAVDIDRAGGLMLETAAGPRTVTAGDTHHI